MLSGGRFILGVGTGYLKAEFAALGVDFDERNALFDEAIDVLPLHWSGEPFSVRGPALRGARATSAARARPPGPPDLDRRQRQGHSARASRSARRAGCRCSCRRSRDDHASPIVSRPRRSGDADEANAGDRASRSVELDLVFPMRTARSVRRRPRMPVATASRSPSSKRPASPG